MVGSWGMPEGFHGGELEAVLEIVGDDGMIVYRGGDTLELTGKKGCERIGLDPVDGYEEELGYFIRCVQGRAAPARSDHLSVEGTMEVLGDERDRGVRAAGVGGWDRMTGADGQIGTGWLG